MRIDLSKLQGASFMPGLTTIGLPLPFQTVIPAQPIPIGSSIQTTLSLILPKVDAMTSIRVNILGGNLGAFWFPVTGFFGALDALSVSPLQFAYYILFTVTGTPTGRNLNIEVINETAAAIVNIPTLTINVSVETTDYPF